MSAAVRSVVKLPAPPDDPRSEAGRVLKKASTQSASKAASKEVKQRVKKVRPSPRRIADKLYSEHKQRK